MSNTMLGQLKSPGSMTLVFPLALTFLWFLHFIYVFLVSVWHIKRFNKQVLILTHSILPVYSGLILRMSYVSQSLIDCSEIVFIQFFIKSLSGVFRPGIVQSRSFLSIDFPVLHSGSLAVTILIISYFSPTLSMSSSLSFVIIIFLFCFMLWNCMFQAMQMLLCLIIFLAMFIFDQ